MSNHSPIKWVNPRRLYVTPLAHGVGGFVDIGIAPGQSLALTSSGLSKLAGGKDFISITVSQYSFDSSLPKLLQGFEGLPCVEGEVKRPDPRGLRT